MKLHKVDGTTYAVDQDSRQTPQPFFFVEQKADGRWDAYASLNPDSAARRQTLVWSAPAYKTRGAALRAISAYRRRRPNLGYFASR